MLVRNPKNGKTHNVTARAFERVYKDLGFELLGVVEDDANKATGGQNGSTAAAGTDGGTNTDGRPEDAAGAKPGSQENGESKDDNPNPPAKLTIEELEGMMDTKRTVMAALKAYAVPFSDRTGVEALRETLSETLAGLGVLPDGFN